MQDIQYAPLGRVLTHRLRTSGDSTQHPKGCLLPHNSSVLILSLPQPSWKTPSFLHRDPFSQSTSPSHLPNLIFPHASIIASKKQRAFPPAPLMEPDYGHQCLHLLFHLYLNKLAQGCRAEHLRGKLILCASVSQLEHTIPEQCGQLLPHQRNSQK